MANLSVSTNQWLNNLIATGSDAMSNLFYVNFHFPPISQMQASDYSLTIRNSNFRMPTFSQGTHSISYMTTSIDLPTASIEGEKELEFTFRVDQNYAVYLALKRLQSLTSLPTKGFAGSEIPGTSSGANKENAFNISVYAMDHAVFDPSSAVVSSEEQPLNTFHKLYEFNYCWIKSITGLHYNYESSDPVEVTVNVEFLSHKEIESLQQEG